MILIGMTNEPHCDAGRENMMERADRQAYILKLRDMTVHDVFVEWGTRYDARDKERADLAAAELGRRPEDEQTKVIQL